MRDSSDATLQPIKVDYLQDTLFGVNALASECTGQLVRTAPDLQLRLAPPWPGQLLKAYRVTFKWDGQTYGGVVQKAEPLTDGDLLLDIEAQP